MVALMASIDQTGADRPRSGHGTTPARGPLAQAVRPSFLSRFSRSRAKSSPA